MQDVHLGAHLGRGVRTYTPTTLWISGTIRTSATSPAAMGPTLNDSSAGWHDLKKFQLMNISLFWDKTFVVRPTSDLKKLKFMKICQKLVENRQNTPLGPFLGVRPKKNFFKKFQLININLFWDKSFALKSRITNFCMKSDILQQIASCE